jgi:hypothetical protein
VGSIAILLCNIAMLVALANSNQCKEIEIFMYMQLQLLGVLTICLELYPNVRCQAFDWLVLYLSSQSGLIYLQTCFQAML